MTILESDEYWPPEGATWGDSGLPVPTKPLQVAISKLDGLFWSDFVVVDPMFDQSGYVSPAA